jgi:hypothetical protein
MRFIMLCEMSLVSGFEMGMNTGRRYGGFTCFGK